jgi:hypothetical protein
MVVSSFNYFFCVFGNSVSQFLGPCSHLVLAWGLGIGYKVS